MLILRFTSICVINVIFLINLVGCLSPEELKHYEQQKQLEEQRKFANLQSICDKYGFKRETNAYASCLQRAERDLKDAKDKANQESDERWRRTQCYASGRMDC